MPFKSKHSILYKSNDTTSKDNKKMLTLRPEVLRNTSVIQYCASPNDTKIKEVESEVIATPAKPTSSLPSDFASIEDSNVEELKLVKVENNLVPAQLSIDKMQSTSAESDPVKLTEECTAYDQEDLVRKQISSETDANLKSTSHKNTCKTNEINVKHDEQIQLSEPVAPIVKRKRGRPRKTESNSTVQNISMKSKNDTLQEVSNTITDEPMTRNRRSTSKIQITAATSDLSDENDTADVCEDESFIKKLGRPVGSRGRGRRRGRGRGRGRRTAESLDREYIPKSMKNDVSQSKTVENNNTDSEGPDLVDNVKNSNTPTDKNAVLVTCAKCNEQVSKRQWSSHNLSQHNNMAWQEHEEPLDFENDEKLLKKVLSAAIKKKKSLTCEKCRAVKRSALGFISHIQFCGKTEEERQALMITCPICNAIMMPSSMEVHERYHRQLEQNKYKEAEEQIIRREKPKRKAAEKAVPKILELAKSMKEKDLCTTNKANFYSKFRNLIQVPELKKKIPTVWKGLWKKELTAKGVVSCKQKGCTYTCSSYESICEHFSQCNFTPQENFICKICKVFANSRDKIVDHIMEVHPNNEDLEKHSDFENDKENEDSDESITEFGSKTKKHYSPRITNSDRMFSKMAFLASYRSTLHWTIEFEKKNYKLSLFNDLMPNLFILLKNNDAARYLPELTTSMSFKHVNDDSSKNTKENSDNSWKYLDRFQGGIYEGVPAFFVGGPIWALAWLPIPSLMHTKKPTQYIAISTHTTMEGQYAIGRKYSGPNIIQIWDVGSLDHEVNNTNKSPALAYAIAHNSGTVWCLEWCPSGCYQDADLNNYCKTEDENKLRRMGLLAAACSDGCVNIYSLPFPEEFKFVKVEDNLWPIYKTEPVITLVVNHLLYDNNKQDWQCTKLSWTKENGHNFIAAGFTNGYIALWHLTTTSSLLLNVRNTTKFINASQHFFAHQSAVTMVALVPYNNSRYLASASTDRLYKFWDLEDTSAPQNYSKKGIITDGVWMTNWPCAVLSFDDALGYSYTHSYIIPLREYAYKYCPLLPANTPTYSIAVSDYANSIAHATLAGEVVTIFPHQLMHIERLLPKKRQLMSRIQVIDFSKEQQEVSSKDNKNKNDKKTPKDYHYMPETYNECKSRFGIIFHDNLTDLKENFTRGEPSLHSSSLTSIPIEQYAFTSANKVAWNPNRSSSLCLVVGYQNGLMRLLNIKCTSILYKLKT